MLGKMVADANSHPSLVNVHLVTAYLFGFFHFDELIIHIKPCNIILNATMARVHIPSSKTDQFRQGSEVIIAHSEASMCPVNMMEHHMFMTGVDLASEQFLFELL